MVLNETITVTTRDDRVVCKVDLSAMPASIVERAAVFGFQTKLSNAYNSAVAKSKTKTPDADYEEAGQKAVSSVVASLVAGEWGRVKASHMTQTEKAVLDLFGQLANFPKKGTAWEGGYSGLQAVFNKQPADKQEAVRTMVANAAKMEFTL